SDYQNVTVYPRLLVQSFHLEANSAFTNPELLLKAWWCGIRFKEVATPFIGRKGGKAKGTRPRALLSAVRDVFYWRFCWMILDRRDNHGTGHVDYWDELDVRHNP